MGIGAFVAALEYNNNTIVKIRQRSLASNSFSSLACSSLGTILRYLDGSASGATARGQPRHHMHARAATACRCRSNHTKRLAHSLFEKFSCRLTKAVYVGTHILTTSSLMRSRRR